MIVLGLHKDPWHNSGAAVIRDDGDAPRFANVSEERCDRQKDSRQFPELSTAACLETLGSSIDDVDLVVLDYIMEPDWRRDYYRRPCIADTFLSAMDPAKIHVINHHLAHAHAVY